MKKLILLLLFIPLVSFGQNVKVESESKVDANIAIDDKNESTKIIFKFYI